MDMEEKSLKVLAKDFVTAFCELVQSYQGKYTLESYLGLVGEFADQVILKSLKDNLKYEKGMCYVFDKGATQDMFTISIELYFSNQSKKTILKKAEREIAKERFTRESIKIIESKKIQKYSIAEPKEK